MYILNSPLCEGSAMAVDCQTMEDSDGEEAAAWGNEAGAAV